MRFLVRLALVALVLATVVKASYPQSGAVIPQSGAGHAKEASCVILKRMGPADQVTSRLYSFGIRGKQFQYVEGKLPNGFPFHGRLTDHDVRNLQARGAEVIVVNQDFTSDDLRQARADCQAQTGRTPAQAEAKLPGGQPEAKTVATKPAGSPTSAANASPTSATLDISSTPPNADIELDGNFAGNTPSSVGVPPGEHTIRISKAGFGTWERKIKSSSGSVRISAELEATTAAPTPTAAAAPPPSSPQVAAAATAITKSTEQQPAATTPAAVVKPAVMRSSEPAAAQDPAAATAASGIEGTASITSDPDDAEIFVDSVGHGHAPALVKLKPGKHHVQLAANGYKDWVSDVEVKAGSIVNVSGKLEK